MTKLDIANQRLHNQRLIGTPFETPGDVVRFLGAVQSQDYAGAKWAIAQRTKRTSDAELDHLFNEGAILRTHILRPTWHFVMPADIRWMLKLTGPRVNAASAYYYRQLELDDAIFRRANAAFAKALQGGTQLTRAELSQVLKDSDIQASGVRLAYIVLRAELDAIVCSGALRGKRFTYALLDERVPQTRTLERDEALAELTLRYLTSHGPALPQDYAWWSGLTMADAKAGFEMVKPHVQQETVDGKTYWWVPRATRMLKAPIVHLLPNYDEYLIAYKDHSSSSHPLLKNLARGDDALRAHIIVLNGQVVGGWRREIKKDEVEIKTDLQARLNKAELADLRVAAERYGRFIGRTVTLT
jgi:hypothetical protein